MVRARASAPRLGKSGVETIDTRAEHGQGPRPQARHLTRGEIKGDEGRCSEMYGRYGRATCRAGACTGRSLGVWYTYLVRVRVSVSVRVRVRVRARVRLG